MNATGVVGVGGAEDVSGDWIGRISFDFIRRSSAPLSFPSLPSHLILHSEGARSLRSSCSNVFDETGPFPLPWWVVLGL